MVEIFARLARRVRVRVVAGLCVILGAIGVPIAVPAAASAAHIAYSRWCSTSPPICPIWPYFNQGAGIPGPALPYYYEAGNDNYGEEIYCAIGKHSDYPKYDKAYYGYGSCSVGYPGQQANNTQIGFGDGIPNNGDGLGGIAYWCDSNGCS
jgi:hypothetical protein